MKRIFSLLLTLSLLGSLLVVPAFAADETVPLREDWRLTGDLDLNVPEGDTLTLQGNGCHIYEMGGKLTNSGGGTVTFANGTILYPAAGDEDAARFTPNGIWDNEESNALMALRAGGHLVNIAPTVHGTVTVDKLAAKEGDTVTVTAMPDNGYKLGTLSVTDGFNQNVSVNSNAFAMPTSDVTVTATFVIRTSGGGSSSSNSTANPNDSTGTVTETTTNPDGSKEVVETAKDGTVTTTTTDTGGNKTEVVEKPDGSSEITVTNMDGSASATTVSAEGKSETMVTLPAAVVDTAGQAGEMVALPMPEVPVTADRESAPTVTVSLPTSSAVKVEIPAENVTAGTVAVLVKEDGTEEVIKTSLTTENGVAVTLSDGDTVKIVDNSKTFDDVADNYWGAEAVAFASSRELFAGTSATTFEPETAMTRAMIVTVLARFEGVDTSTGDTWYEAGQQWAMQNGVSDGTNMDASLTREQLATMLYRYAQSKGYDTTQGGMAIREYAHFDQISGYAVEAMTWAVNTGLISGTTTTTLSPQGPATRAQVAAILMRFIQANA